MSGVNSTNVDRRERPRSVINSHISYKLDNEDTEFNVAKMLDLSQTGVLVKIHEKLDTKTRLTLQIKSKTVDEDPIEIIAKIVRIANAGNDEQYCYGCEILDIINF